ncbi:MAG: hypothetical protein KGJ13_02785 [Patescibacteria group bacterium]|nr:hypothetical protein [Patescibacteria group bacterium]
MRRSFFAIFAFFAICLLSFSPFIFHSSASAVAATLKPKFYYGAWLPFWQAQNGAADVAVNLNKLQEVSPFSYEISPSGQLIDDLNIGNGSWDGWFSAARAAGVKIIPTIAWFNGSAMLNLMQNTKKRIAHENMIAALAKSENFDGIDIDYESKPAAIRPYFSTFIYGLAIRLHAMHKTLTCTVESRTPPSDGTVITPDERANNYTVMNQYCDEVRVMAYDQGLVYRKLDNAMGSSTLYAPVADPQWVNVVLEQTLKYIKPGKIMLGIPTYGYEWQVTWNNGETTYQRVRSFTYTQAMDRADEVGIAPVRTASGELSLTFNSTTVVGPNPGLTWTVSSTLPLALTDPPANASNTFYITFSDAQSMADKISLAKKLKLRGVMFFKADGMMDPAIWDQIQ